MKKLTLIAALVAATVVLTSDSAEAQYRITRAPRSSTALSIGLYGSRGGIQFSTGQYRGPVRGPHYRYHQHHHHYRHRVRYPAYRPVYPPVTVRSYYYSVPRYVPAYPPYCW